MQMTYEDLIRQLRRRSALIVHFSHHSNMRQGGVFPADLHAAMANSRNWPLSCCVVWPRHRMQLPGSVGVVLLPRSLDSIVLMHFGDSGSMTIDGGEYGLGANQVTEEAVEHTFKVPPNERYNEWRVRESDAIGIYVEGRPYVKKYETVKKEEHQITTITPQSISLQEIHDAFSELPIYSRHEERIVATNVPGNVVYPWSLTGTGAAVR
jgi:hypothetical protein